MISASFAARSEFLAYYRHDVQLRWSETDREEQREFVNQHIAGSSWLDWSTEGAAMELIQASLTNISVSVAGRYEAVVLAGPVAELIEPVVLFQQAIAPLKSPGCLIGITPCLRDNSPESQLFAELGYETLVAQAKAGTPRKELEVPRPLLEAVCALGSAAALKDRIADYHRAGADHVGIAPSTAEDPAGRRLLAAVV